MCEHEYTEICRDVTADYEQIISVENEFGVFKIETEYSPKYKIDKKTTFISKQIAEKISQYLKGAGANEKKTN